MPSSPIHKCWCLRSLRYKRFIISPISDNGIMVHRETARNPKKLKPSHANAYEKRREIYSIACARGPVNKRAALEAGLNTRQARRMARRITAVNSTRDCVRSGRPPTYTPGVLQAAVAILGKLPALECTPARVMDLLVEKQHLKAHGNTQAFMRAFNKYVKKHHKRLMASSTRTRFFLTEKDKLARLRYAKLMLRIWAANEAAALSFFDETTLEASPHPKSGVLPKQFPFISRCVLMMHACECYQAGQSCASMLSTHLCMPCRPKARMPVHLHPWRHQEA